MRGKEYRLFIIDDFKAVDPGLVDALFDLCRIDHAGINPVHGQAIPEPKGGADQSTKRISMNII